MTFLRGVKTSDMEEKMLQRAVSLSPVGRRRIIDFSSKTRKEQHPPFSKSWRIERMSVFSQRNAISFKLWNTLSTIYGERGEAHFASVEYGSRAWVLKPTRPIPIFSVNPIVNADRSVVGLEWNRAWLKKNKKYKIPARRGAYVGKRTAAYARRELAPIIAQRVVELFKRRILE